MESKVQLQYNGQQLTTTEFNLLGDVAGLADDRVLAELFRLPSYDGATVSRGIVHSALFGKGGAASAPLVGPNGASGSVLVQPFRALIGSRTVVASGAKATWRDIRSAINVGATALAQSISFTANSSGNARWDLIYAAVAVDASSTAITRKVKDPTTKVISGTLVSTSLATMVTLAVVTGTAAASPAWPTVPVDSGSTYYIPLAYVRIPNGFSPTSTVASTDICVVADMIGMAPAVGTSMAIATVNNQKSLLTTPQASWGNTGTPQYQSAPPIAPGIESIMLFIDMTTGTGNVVNNTILDGSRDWSRRYFRATVSFGAAYTGSTHAAPHRGGTAGGASGIVTSSRGQPIPGVTMLGSSFVTGTSTTQQVLIVTESSLQGTITGLDMPAGTGMSIYVDSQGRLVANVTGSPNCQLLVWLDATARFE